MENNKTLGFAIWTAILSAVILFVTFRPTIAAAQTYTIYTYNERGDSIPNKFTPSDSNYVRNEVIVKFRKGALNNSMLCYTCDRESAWHKGDPPIALSDFSACRNMILSQHFNIDSGILPSAPFIAALHAVGGLYLRRITAANPCTDTLSVSRRGDTIQSDDYDWMVLKLNNDTSVLMSCFLLTTMWQTQVELVGPNKLGHLLSRTPSDPEYPIHQYSLSNMIGMPTAWDYEVGKYSVKVGIVDNGLDFHHCDLGAAFGVGSKVSGGYYYADQSTNIDIECVHGTLVAGVIGALTNRDNCGAAAPTGVAGIGGGWGTNNGYPDQLIGLQLIGLKVSPIGKEELVDLSSAIAAIREGSANYVDHTHGIAHAFGVDVLNNSWSVFALADENLRSAVNYAFQNGVSFVAGTGNHYLHDPVVDYYPASYDPDWVVAVGAEDHNGNPEWYTQECSKTDLLGPGGDHSNPADIIVWSTMPGGTYGVLDGTSAATPHVSGVLGLLRSKTKSLPWASRLETEDYEGILKASSVSYNFNQVLPTSWNDPKGWGNLHADQLFQMLDPDHFNVIPWSNYQLVHFSDNWNPKYGAWIDATNETFHLGGKQSTKNPADYTYTNGVQYRSVDFTKTLTTGEWNDYWDLTQPVFAWGTSGAGDPDNGWELGNPNYETGFTQITNGEGGNSNNDGIIHTSNSTFNLRTYQWRKEKGGSAYDYYPCEGTSISGHFIRYNFSVYGRALVHADGVAVSKDELGTFNLQLFPTSANSHVNVSYTLDRSSIRQLSILDVLGREVLSVPPETRYSGSQIERFEISKLPDGMYTCRVTSCGKIASARFLVGH